MTNTSAPVAVITGASAGIGKATAAQLASKGWLVIGCGRNEARIEQAQREIEAVADDGGSCSFVQADFSSMSEVRRAADEIKGKTDRLDVLINNAGGIRDGLYKTADGFEATFAVNHLAAFLLTRELLPLLEKTGPSERGPARVIAVSSSAHRTCQELHWQDLNMFDDFDAASAYGQAKLANLLFTRELDRRMSGRGVIAQAMHPGRVDTNFASYGNEGLQSYLASVELDTPDRPAITLAWLANAPEVATIGSRYFYDMHEEQPASQALDDRAAARLWSESETMLSRIGV